MKARFDVERMRGLYLIRQSSQRKQSSHNIPESKEQPLRSILYNRFCFTSFLHEQIKRCSTYIYGHKTLKISMKERILAKLKTSSKQLN